MALGKLMQEDPTFRVHTDKETGPDDHRRHGRAAPRDHRRPPVREFNVEANVGKPQVAYKETITHEAEGEGRFVRQTGGRGQYGHAKIRLVPGDPARLRVRQRDRRRRRFPRSSSSRSSRASRRPWRRGILAGYPVDDVEVELYDGIYHDVDSSEMAFKIAGSMAFQDAAQAGPAGAARAGHGVEVVMPEEYMGDVIGDITCRRGRIQCRRHAAGTQMISARCRCRRCSAMRPTCGR